MNKGIVLAGGILWLVFCGVSPSLAGSSAAPVFHNGVLVSGGEPAPLVPDLVVVDSFRSLAGYSMGLAYDGAHIWNDEAFAHTFWELDIHGSLQRTFTPSEGNRDMTFDGKYIWATDWSTLHAAKYDTGTGSWVASYSPPFSGHPNGMAWDGHYLWVGEEGGRIYQVDTTLQLLRSIPAPNNNMYNPRGLAFDGTDLWVGNQTPGLIYQIDTVDGAVKNTYSSPCGTVQQGLAWDGRYLWATGGNNWIYKIDTNPVGVQERPVDPGCVAGIRVVPEPFTKYARVPGHEGESFGLYDLTGRKVGTFRGDRIGEGLPAGVYFLKGQDQRSFTVRILKVR